MRNPYQPVPAEITRVVEESPNIKTFALRLALPLGFATGQFMELTVPGVGEAPFTPSSHPGVSEDMEFTVMRVGRVTEALHAMRPGDQVAVRGPYGVGYPLDEFRGQPILIVGGGVGLAPLRSLFLALADRLDDWGTITLCYGARTPADIIYKDLILKKWPAMAPGKVRVLTTVDHAADGWSGRVGVVTVLLDDLEREANSTGTPLGEGVAVVCGPPIMMKFATLKLIEMGYPPGRVYLSMERNMSCGIGQCGHCMLGPYYICKDGPVFTYEKVKDLPAVFA